jgi:hypothetical protein
MEPITCAIAIGIKALYASLTHSAVSYPAVHTVAFAPHVAYTAAPHVAYTAAPHVAYTAGGGVPALRGASAVLGEAGATAGFVMNLGDAFAGVRTHDSRRTVKGAAEAAVNLHDFFDILW